MNKNCENCIWFECEEHGDICPFYDEQDKEAEGDLISRETLKKALNYTYDCAYIDSKSKEGIVSDIIETIDNAPTVKYTFEEAFQKTVCENRLYCPARPQGEWYYNYQNGWHCSICHEPVKDMPTVMGKADFAFCPNCGAKMRNGGKE